MAKIKVDEVAHSRLGASGASRWMACPGSVKLAGKLYAEGEAAGSGDEARRGTAAHEVAARCLKDGTEPFELADSVVEVEGRDYEVDQDMMESVQLYVDFVRKKLAQHADKGATLHVEEALSSMLDDQAFGTADAIIVVPGDRIIVVDFKNGRNICVEPTSPQLKYYGYLVCENAARYTSDTEFKVAELWIAQPRMPHPKGRLRQLVTSPKELTDWFTGTLIPAMEATRKEGAILNVGEHCRFCEASKTNTCPAIRKETASFSLDVDPEHLTSHELGEALQKMEAIARAKANYEKVAYKRAMQGEVVTGYKIVRKMANRIFQDGVEERARETFGDDAFTEPKLRTPAQIEKLDGGKSFVSKYAFSPDNGLTLAQLSDKREAVKPAMLEYMDRLDAAELT